MTPVHGKEDLLWHSTERQFPPPYLKANCSVMKKAHSLAPLRRPLDVFKLRTGEHCSSMRSEICPWNCSRNSCACFRSSNTNAWAALVPCAPTYESSLQPTRILPAWWDRRPSALISTIG